MNIIRSAQAPLLWDALKIRILEHGLAQLHQDWNQSHARPPYSRLYYILDGEGFVRAGKTEIPLLPGNCYLLPCGMSLSYRCPSEMTQLYFHISARTTDGYDLFSRCESILQMPARQAPSQMGQSYLSKEYLPLALLQRQIESDLCFLIAQAGLENHLLNPRSPFLESVFMTVRKNMRSSLSIPEIAAILSLSESTLTKRFRKEYGMPLGRYIDEMLAQEIGRLLTGTDMTIGQIAESLGFCDQFYLTRFFSAHQGMPPSRYRSLLKVQK